MRKALTILVAFVVLSWGAVPVAMAAGQAPGTIRAVINAPVGVPINVPFTGLTGLVASKPPAGTSTVVNLSAPASSYMVGVPRISWNGTAYVGRPSLPSIAVLAGRTADVTVTYAQEAGASAFHTTNVTPTSVAMTWTPVPGTQVFVKRSEGPVVPANPWAGVPVPVQGTTAIDQGLRPGARYTYALFSLDRTGMHGPVVLQAGTGAAAGANTQASYIASAGTLLAAPADLVSATPIGNGVRAVLAPKVPTPTLGAGVVLPISPALPGGFLGVVRSISPDGRTVELDAGGLADAFDYYELVVPDIAAVPEAAVPPAAAAPAPSAKIAPKLAPQSEQSAPQPEQSATPNTVPAPIGPRGPKGDRGDRPAPPAGAENFVRPRTAIAPAAPTALATSCTGSASGPTVDFTHSIALGGHFNTKIDKYSFLGVDVPTGGTLDTAITATVTGAAAVNMSASASCSITLPPVARMLAVSPVPMAALFKGRAEVTANGAITTGNLGITATAGVAVKGSMSIKNGASFTGNPIMDAKPLVPSPSGTASVTAKAGGELTVGPGAMTNGAGVVAGVTGTLYPVDALLKPGLCTTLDAGFSRKVDIVAQAFLGKAALTMKVPVDALTGTTPYPGSPYRFPAGCSGSGGGTKPSDTLLGTGVTKVSDSTVGQSDQWGHVDGFAPGKKTWVLSTGSINDAIGTPGQFASTDLGGPGDPKLTAAAGNPTFDAAAYTVTVVPTGKTLHVKYVFASEEYPEYVGSAYNDVMAVRVNGATCSQVPGTKLPVAVNTVNDHTNAQYYVDNATGAAGYSTSMDGLTKPLTCDVPVTPGKAVTVQVAVADTSDAIYDSAVALVDGGIWTD